jgi:hypothetical protein
VKSEFLARIKPPWIQQPAYIKKIRSFLGDQLSQSVRLLRPYLIAKPRLRRLLEGIDELVQSMEPLRQVVNNTKSQLIIKHIIHKCAETAKIGDARSVEDHLKSLSLPPRVRETTEIRPVDKLARYLFFCSDLINSNGKLDLSEVKAGP